MKKKYLVLAAVVFLMAAGGLYYSTHLFKLTKHSLKLEAGEKLGDLSQYIDGDPKGIKVQTLFDTNEPVLYGEYSIVYSKLFTKESIDLKVNDTVAPVVTKIKDIVLKSDQGSDALFNNIDHWTYYDYSDGEYIDKMKDQGILDYINVTDYSKCTFTYDDSKVKYDKPGTYYLTFCVHDEGDNYCETKLKVTITN